MPGNMNPPIPGAFLERMHKLLGEEFPTFEAALEQAPVSGLRVNTLKLSPSEFQKISPGELGQPVPWCPSAFLLPDSDFSFGRHPYHLAGLYYLQDPSAMAPAELLNPQPGERVLDLAAAPGGKTTHLAALMQGQGLLVANEIKDKRLGHLAFNVERWGAGNVIITNETPERLADHFGPSFDRVLVDAPCSGEGMFRKDMGARQDWSIGMVEGCSIRQRNILRVAARLVRPGGYLLYSTCTFAPEEDEGVINGLLSGPTDKNGLPEFEVVQARKYPGFMSGRPDWLEDGSARNGLEGAVRLFPHRIQGEGHFACLLRRTDEGSRPERRAGRPGRNSVPLAEPAKSQALLWQGFAEEVLNLSLPPERLRLRGERLYLVPEILPDLGDLRLAHPGVWLGTFKKDRFEPAHPLALFLHRGQARNELHLASSDSRLGRYLRGESIPAEGPSGWTVVSVDGWPLGWGKRVQGVVKNHYPRGWQTYA
jgi:NOL1/NOP2/sun family putative RNA methylase